METEKFKRTRRMILSRVLVAPFITTMIVCGTLIYYMAVNLRGQVKEDLTRIADGHRRLIEQFLQERTNDLEFAASTHRLEDFQKPEVMAGLLAKLQMGSQAFLDLGAFDEAGNHLAYAGPYDLAGKSYASAEWFARVRERDVYISDVFLGYRHSPHFIIAVKKVEGGRTWYLRSTIDTLFLT